MRRNIAWAIGVAAVAALVVAIWSPYHWQFVLTGIVLLFATAAVAVEVGDPAVKYDGVVVRNVDVRYGGDNTVSIQIELGRAESDGSHIDVRSLPPQARAALKEWVA